MFRKFVDVVQCALSFTNKLYIIIDAINQENISLMNLYIVYKCSINKKNR